MGCVKTPVTRHPERIRRQDGPGKVRRSVIRLGRGDSPLSSRIRAERPSNWRKSNNHTHQKSTPTRPLGKMCDIRLKCISISDVKIDGTL